MRSMRLLSRRQQARALLWAEPGLHAARFHVRGAGRGTPCLPCETPSRMRYHAAWDIARVAAGCRVPPRLGHPEEPRLRQLPCANPLHPTRQHCSPLPLARRWSLFVHSSASPLRRLLSGVSAGSAWPAASRAPGEPGMALSGSVHDDGAVLLRCVHLHGAFCWRHQGT